MKTIEYKIEVADVPDDITEERLAEHKARILRHVETTIDAHHADLLKRQTEWKKKSS